MGRNGNTQQELPLFKAPEIVIPFTKIPQPNGDILIRPGKPVVVEEMIGTSEAARLLGMSRRWVETECSEGRFRTAHKPGTKTKARWKVARSEVMERKQMAVE